MEAARVYGDDGSGRGSRRSSQFRGHRRSGADDAADDGAGRVQIATAADRGPQGVLVGVAVVGDHAQTPRDGALVRQWTGPPPSAPGTFVRAGDADNDGALEFVVGTS